MGFWGFLSSLIWPGLILFLANRYKSEIRSLIARLRTVQMPGLQLDMAEAKELGDGINSPELLPQPSGEEKVTTQANPTGLIMEKWIEVVAAARRYLEIMHRVTIKHSDDSRLPTGYQIQDLLQGNIPTLEMALFKKLRKIRNIAAYSSSRPTSDEAEDFAMLADRLMLAWSIRMESGDPKE